MDMYNRFKQSLDEIVDEIGEGYRIWSWYQWCEKGKKSNKFFLDLKKAQNFRSNAKCYIKYERLK